MGNPRLPDLGVEILRYREPDRAALLAFRREHYGAGSAQADGAYVDWQFRDAPGVAATGAPLHVAWKEGRIVGTIGTIRTSLHVAGRVVPACWVVDFAVSRELRRGGIGEALSAASRADGRTRLVIDATPATQGIIARAGHHGFGDVPLFVRPIDPRRLSRSHRLPRPLAVLAGATRPAFAALDAAALRSARSQRVELVETAALDERADALFAALAGRHPVICRRDRAWLEWRFQRYPRKGRYRLHWLMKGGEAAGYAVLREGVHRDLAAGVLADYLSPPELVPALLALAIERFRAAGAAVVTCLNLNPRAAGAFFRLGFFRRRSGWSFAARPESPSIGAAFFDRRSWFITAADSNVDREREAV